VFCIFGHWLSVGIASYLGVEDENTSLKFGNSGEHFIAVFGQQLAAIRLGLYTADTQLCITQHLLYRHASRF